MVFKKDVFKEKWIGIDIKLGSAFNALPSAKIAFHSNDNGLVAIDNQDISLVAGNTYRYKIEILRVSIQNWQT